MGLEQKPRRECAAHGDRQKQGRLPPATFLVDQNRQDIFACSVYQHSDDIDMLFFDDFVECSALIESFGQD